MAGEDTSTGMKQTQAFETCIDSAIFSGLSGCTVDCAPTFGMLAASENPTTAEVSNFGAGSNEASLKPATSHCEME